MLSFVQASKEAQSDFGHLGIRVEDKTALLQERDRISAAGFELREEMGVKCCYAQQDKFWVQDPDGREWEVYHFEQDVEQNDAPYAMETLNEDREPCCEPGCCQ